MTRTTVEITTDLLADLKVLKGVLKKGNMTDVIRGIMWSAGYRPAFFEKMEELKLERRMPGDFAD